jgi:cyclic beta-1,2-glucan synthetase
VTVVADAAAPESVAKIAALQADARALAEVQRDLTRAARLVTLFYERPPVARPLERARRQLGAISSGDAPHPKAAEWFLDNYYLIRRVARQVEEELPRGFVRHLPQLASGPSKGRPRVDALARALVAKSAVLDLAVLRRFVDAYQQVSPLTIAELWALPTMLRATVLRHLLRFLNELHVPVHGSDLKIFHLFADHDDEPEAISLDPGVGVERSIRTLRVLDSIDWKAFFAKTNRVEAILRTDPASVYARMDFETCDSYRKVVEALAWATGRAEEDVANLAIGLANDDASDARRGHVGHFLVAGGRRLLEERIGYRPIGVDRVRRAVRSWPTVSYLLPLALLTLGPVLALSWFIAANVGRGDSRLVSIAVAAIVAVVPASAVAVAVLHSLFARLLPPCALPKLDFEKGLPGEARTLVVIPTLLGRAEDVAAMIRQIELHYLSNPDPELQFALLTDWVDAKTLQEISEKGSLLESVSQKITALNAKHASDGHGPFHLLHRHPRWNPGEDRFMGWERKRGKLEELNRLLRGDTTTSFSLHVGNPDGLLGIRFVITLDSDTELPMGSAHRLVGLLAHPLNRAVFEAGTGRVIAGYTIAQPRIETSPSSSRRTLFSRIFAGDVGFDIYTHATSELYQDLFGAGIYVGKGIYDVDAFMRSVEGCVPENALVSHDLFEGIQGRTALASDIVLFESYPSNYATYALRMHRWVRGDWQLLPWLFPRVPSGRGGFKRNDLAPIDRWKIADNLRRSMTSPLVLVLLVLSFVWLPGNAALWALGALALLVAPILPALAHGRRALLEGLSRCALAITFLAFESSVVVDAIVRTLVRKTLTRTH